jgi:hypothetical protein
MAEFTYYHCVVNSDHPKKKVPCYALVKPYCCGKPMVRVPIDADQSNAKPQVSTHNVTETKSAPVNPTQPQSKK